MTGEPAVGRALDEAIARLLGWTGRVQWAHEGDCRYEDHWWTPPGGRKRFGLPCWSTDDAACAELRREMLGRGWVCIQLRRSTLGYGVEVLQEASGTRVIARQPTEPGAWALACYRALLAEQGGQP